MTLSAAASPSPPSQTHSSISISPSAAPRDPSPPPPVPILSLPPELMQLCFELGSEETEDDGHTFLRMASLVIHEWRDLAQRLLWKVVRISNAEAAARLLQSVAFGRYPIRNLTIVASSIDVSGGTYVGKILAQAEGVDKLVFEGNAYARSTLEVDLLWSPNLHSVTSITIAHFYIYHSRDSPPLSSNPPFFSSLSHVSLWGVRHWQPLSNIYTLLFAGPSVWYLSLISLLTSDAKQQDIQNLLTVVGPALIFLTLDIGSSLPPSFMPILRSCQQLQLLAIRCSLDELVEVGNVLTHPLYSLGIIRAEADESEDVVPALLALLKKPLFSAPPCIVVVPASGAASLEVVLPALKMSWAIRGITVDVVRWDDQH